VKITVATITDAQILECEPSAYECPTCLGNRRIRDGETGDLRRCLDCGGSGQRPDARARCAKIFNAKPSVITDAQEAFLRDIGLGREIFAPNPSILRALRKRGLVAARFIGMRWWWVQPTKAGAEVLIARSRQ